MTTIFIKSFQEKSVKFFFVEIKFLKLICPSYGNQKSQLLVLSMKKTKKGILIMEDNYSRTFYIKISDRSELNLSIHRYHLHCDKVLYDKQQDHPRCKQYYFSSFLQSNNSYSVLWRSTSKAWLVVCTICSNIFSRICSIIYPNIIHHLKLHLTWQVLQNCLW